MQGESMQTVHRYGLLYISIFSPSKQTFSVSSFICKFKYNRSRAQSSPMTTSRSAFSSGASSNTAVSNTRAASGSEGARAASTINTDLREYRGTCVCVCMCVCVCVCVCGTWVENNADNIQLEVGRSAQAHRKSEERLEAIPKPRHGPIHKRKTSQRPVHRVLHSGHTNATIVL